MFPIFHSPFSIFHSPFVPYSVRMNISINHIRIAVVCLVIVLLQAGCDRGPEGPSSSPNDGSPGRTAIANTQENSSAGRVQFQEIAPSLCIEWTPRNGEEAGHFAIL